jgi:hypothetical protein
MTKLLAAGGYIGGRSSVEIVNLDDSKPNVICSNLSNLPFGLFGSVGQLFRGTTPIICGGYTGPMEKRCNSFENGAWKAISNMNAGRYAPHAISVSPAGNTKDDIFIVSSGTGSDLQTQSTVESFDGVGWNQTQFPNLPFPLMGSCMVKFNNTMIMSIGGAKQTDSLHTGETNVLNIVKNTWMAGPLLAIPRRYHSCGVMNWKNEISGNFEKVVVVSGGYDNQGNQLNSVELLFINYFEKNNSGWKAGPSIPVKVDGPAMVEFQNGVILIGGRGEGDGRHLYQLSSPYGNWTEMKQTLKEPRSHFVSFLVPDSLVTCLPSISLRRF